MKHTLTLKTFCIILLCAATCIWLTSCRNSQKNGDVHEHEECTEIHGDGHDHEAHAHEGHDHADHGHGPEEATESSDEIVLDVEKATAAGVRTEAVRPGKFRDVLAVSGKIMPATGNTTTIVASMPGIIHFPNPIAEGISVQKGRTLFTVSSSNLQDGDPVQRAKIEYETAKAEYERASKLVEDNIVSRQEYEAAKSRYETAKLAYTALATDNGSKGTAIKSPVSGFVKTCLVSEGDYVSVGTPLASIISDGKMFLKADVSERYLDRIGRITGANFKLSYSDKVYSTESLNGKLVGYGRSTDDTNAYIPVTFMIDGDKGILSGAYTTVWLLSDERDGVISLPKGAITEEQGHYFVYIQTDPTCYRKQEVKLGATDGNRYEILSGLKGDENVVTEGAIHVRLASASNAIPAHSHNH